MAEHEELLGADYCEHDIRHSSAEVNRAVSLLQPHFAEVVDPSLEETDSPNKG